MNNKKSKVKIFIVIIAIVIIFLSGIAFGYFYNEFNSENVNSNSSEKTSKVDKDEDENFNGLLLRFKADVEEISEEEKDIVIDIFQRRLAYAGHVEAMVSYKDGMFDVRVPGVEGIENLSELLSTKARVTFRDPDGNIIMDSGTDVKKAEYQYGQLSTESPEEAYISITLNPDAVSKWAYATKLVSQRTDGKNYISIYADDMEISAPMVNEEINSDKCIISGGFTPESAQTLANQINSGSLPFELELMYTENHSNK